MIFGDIAWIHPLILCWYKKNHTSDVRKHCSNTIKLLQQFLLFKKNITQEISVASNKIYQCSYTISLYYDIVSYLNGPTFHVILRKWLVKFIYQDKDLAEPKKVYP